MRVLVTGSHGFIGSQLVKALEARGDDVMGWDIKHDNDLFRLESWSGIDLDEIYHLACVNQEDALRHSYENMMVNAMGAKVMAEFAKRCGARFVYTSTASVYGDQAQQPIGSQRNPAPKSDYAIAKLAGEWFVRNSGADYTIFRLSNVYGPGQVTSNPYCGVVAKFFEAAIHGQPLKIIGDGSQTRDFTYVDDVVGHLMNPKPKGVLNLSYGHETSVLELANLVNDVVGRPRGYSSSYSGEPTFQYAPERPVDGIHRRWLRSDLLCGTSLESGLRKTLQWLQDEEIPAISGFGDKKTRLFDFPSS